LVKEFPISPLEKVAREAGKTVGADRVSGSASREFKNVMLEIADKIAVDAVAVAHHAGRVTVKREDIMLAARK
jgi:histone H3/H4